MIRKHGDAQPINVVPDPKEVIKKGDEDMQQQILKFQESKDEEHQKQTKMER